MFKKMGMAVIVVCALLVVAGVVMAQEATTTETTTTTTSAVTVTETTPAATPAAVNVGNKVCPVTGEKIAELGKDTVEYEGKIYNMCCPMCKDKFLADPAKYIAIVDAELAAEAPAAAAVEVK